MSDDNDYPGRGRLDRLWDDLPVGAAPVDDIVRAGRSGVSAAPRRLRRSLAATAVIGSVAAAFVVGTLVASGDSPLSPSSPADGAGSDLAPAAFHGDLRAPASCNDLLAHYVERGLDEVSAFGWTPALRDQRSFAVDDGLTLSRNPEELDSTRAALAPTTETVTSSETGTNVQEAGVDEPDVVKTDGSLLVRLDEGLLTTYDVSGDQVVQRGALELDDLGDSEVGGELLLAGDTAVVLGTTADHTTAITVDVSDADTPAVAHTVDYDGALLSARQHGSSVRLVISAGLPHLDFERPTGDRRESEALATNRELVEQSTIDDWLPHVSVDGAGAQQLVDCDRVALPDDALGLGTTAVVGFDAADPVTSPGELSTLAVAGDTPLAYESSDHLYLAASGSQPDGDTPLCFDFCGFAPSIGGGTDGTTHVFDFDLDGASASYVGAGEVDGTVADRWAMDEHDGVLRLAVGASRQTGNFSSVVTMRATGTGDAARLEEVGRLDDLGRGEDIKSVRWFDDLAILVTFRQVDPLYTIDLTDQQAPTLLGVLKIPGFSSYLHPLGERRLVGLGEAASARGGSRGAQAGLFRVVDLDHPTRLSTVEYGRGTRARAGDDPRQFTWLPATRTMLTVIERGGLHRTGWVSVLRPVDGELTNQMVQVEYGDDVDDVRLVPLPGANDGPGTGADDPKVVLVTGDDVEFFAPLDQ